MYTYIQSFEVELSILKCIKELYLDFMNEKSDQIITSEMQKMDIMDGVEMFSRLDTSQRNKRH